MFGLERFSPARACRQQRGRRPRHIRATLTPLCPAPPPSALALRGYIDLTSGREMHAKKSLKYFDEALKAAGGMSIAAARRFPSPSPWPRSLSSHVVSPLRLPEGSPHLMSLLGKARYLTEVKYDHAAALSLMQTALAHYSSFVPAMIEKSKIDLVAGSALLVPVVRRFLLCAARFAPCSSP